MNNKQEKVTISLTIQQAEYLDALLWKEDQAKRKRVNRSYLVDTDFVAELQESIVRQTDIMYSYEQLEYMEKIQRED
tara:strand:+ start:177 stop:407 length:231 start_codon:yes stop_codon:yes gene_type:complete